MNVQCLTPILNVSDMAESFAWFEKLGWKKLWDWGDPPSFGAVGCGKIEIFLCEGGQGSRGPRTPEGARDDDGGAWMCWMLESPAEVDEVHAAAVKQGLVVTWPPTDEPWGMREFHLRHPDGHTFRVGAGLGED
jgi:catechol 2,3-dioxygenase-like lactoylglutathione lyase family enzyme